MALIYAFKMRKENHNPVKWLPVLLCGVMLVCSCVPQAKPGYLIPATQTEVGTLPTSTPYPTRPIYDPGTQVDYTAQTGDNLTALAARFNTSIDEIKEANPNIPDDATTMPPGMPMKIPIYYKPLWGSDYQIIPDGAFVNGPDAVGFNVRQFIESTPGWLKRYRTYVSGQNMDAVEAINWVADNYSVNPKLLLALIEYQTGALTNPVRIYDNETTFMGFDTQENPGVYLQISYAANMLNDFYYRYRRGELISFEHLDGRLENIDPWQNAGTAALHLYFSKLYDGEEYLKAIGPDGFAKTYAILFGDPWLNAQAYIPGSLTQPEFILPFEAGTTWAYTGGPHTGWGSLAPWSAVDFAPPIGASGCVETDEFATAVADGVVARTATGIVVLDLDGDGDERTGWVVFYLHVATEDKVSVGMVLKAGDPVGHPSCEGGNSTGTHIHISRKYNGEWIEAYGLIPFNLSGWLAREGTDAYSGTLVRGDQIVIANTNPNNLSFITAEQ